MQDGENIGLNKIQDKDSNNDKKKSYVKIPYQAPEIKSEKLLGFGAVCNGSTHGGRKDTTGAPNFCNSNRLMS